MTYGHLQADCLYTGISSGPNARYRVWEAFTFYLTVAHTLQGHFAESVKSDSLTFCDDGALLPLPFVLIYTVYILRARSAVCVMEWFVYKVYRTKLAAEFCTTACVFLYRNSLFVTLVHNGQWLLGAKSLFVNVGNCSLCSC